MIAADALWFYGAKLLWPAALAPDYGRTPAWVLQGWWPLSALAIVIIAGGAAMFLSRRSPLVLAGSAIAVGSLLPVLGLASFHHQVISTVADRYMYIPLVGWHIAGWPGALATLAATLLPSATLTLGVAYLYKRHPKAAFGLAIRRGLAPITIGLVLASGWILLPAVATDWRGYVLTAVTVGAVMRTSLNPLWVLVGGAIAGMTGLV